MTNLGCTNYRLDLICGFYYILNMYLARSLEMGQNLTQRIIPSSLLCGQEM